MSNGRSSRGVLVWAVLATVFLACSVVVNLVLFLALIFSAGGSAGRPISRTTIFHEQTAGGDVSSRNKIAVIYLTGLISYSVDGVTGVEGMVGDLKEQLRIAKEDDAVKAIVLSIDSPGGEVTASDDIYRVVAEVRKKKPVVVSMGSLAASGGYYVAVGGTHLMANESTITGSIGVILQTLNYRELLDKVGLQMLTIKSGKFKDLLNGSREYTAEEIQIVQKLIQETYEQFVGIVARERKIELEKLTSELADGRVLSGRQAKEAGLIDSIGYFDDALAKAMELAGISEARQVRYVAPLTLRTIMRFLAKSEPQTLTVKVGPDSLRLQSGKLYYVAEQFLQ